MPEKKEPLLLLDNSTMYVVCLLYTSLDIFALRAQSREGKLQVELAQLKYLLPRLTGQGTALRCV